MGNPRITSLSLLGPELSTGYDSATQVVAQGIGAALALKNGENENPEIKAKFIKLLNEAGDDISPDNVSARAKQLWEFHRSFQAGENAKMNVAKTHLQEYYSLIYHLTPEADEQKGRPIFEAAFEKLEIGEAGKRVLSEKEVVAALPDMFGIDLNRGGRAKK